jgi:hypothetical protein
MIFECFHNRGHPETYISEKNPKNYNALERVAVLSDEIADRVRDNSADWKVTTPYMPGRSRFKMMYKGEEIVKPLRSTRKSALHKYGADPEPSGSEGHSNRARTATRQQQRPHHGAPATAPAPRRAGRDPAWWSNSGRKRRSSSRKRV